MTTPHDDFQPYALVVDDDGLIRMETTDILEQAGFRTMEAEDGDAAILVLEQHHLDIALMFSDVDMPGSRNGFALAREAAVRWPTVAIVVARACVSRLRASCPRAPASLASPSAPRWCMTVFGRSCPMIASRSPYGSPPD